jgi:catechol-2,3-dioxygenase
MKYPQNLSLENLVAALKLKLAASPYEAIVSLSQTTATGAEVVIRKFGKSTITFSAENGDLEIIDQDIALFHKKYIPDVYKWLRAALVSL